MFSISRRSALKAFIVSPALLAMKPIASLGANRISKSAHRQLFLRLGGPVFLNTDDPTELAREHRRLGYSAAYCPPAKASDTARTKAIEKAFKASDVVIAEVGAWRNMLESDAEKRRVNLAYVSERLALAEEVGALNCVNIAGSFNPKQWDGPDPRNLTNEFFDATVENCRKVIDEVKPRRTKFSIEMMGWSLPNGPDSYLSLLKAVDRTGLGVHVDICNIIQSPVDLYRSKEVIEETFSKLGRWICSCHAKDLEGRSVHLAETVPGRGGINYRAYVRSIASLEQRAPLMLEHLSKPEEYEEGKFFIKRIADELAVPLA